MTVQGPVKEQQLDGMSHRGVICQTPGMPCTQCKVLCVSKYMNPSFGPLGEHLMRHACGAEIQPCGPCKHPQFLPRGPLI